MRDTDLYTRILGIEAPWQVSTVKVEMAKGEVIVQVERKVGAKLRCPTCGRESHGYDSRRRRWRHLDTCQYKTILEADVPRVECPEHGVVTTSVPWAEPNSGFTAMFEALVIDWLKEASTAVVSRQIGRDSEKNLTRWISIDGDWPLSTFCCLRDSILRSGRSACEGNEECADFLLDRFG